MLEGSSEDKKIFSEKNLSDNSLSVNNSGKVSIGTNTPSAERLTVEGSITASGDISASGTIKAKTLDADAITDGLASVIVAEIDNVLIKIRKKTTKMKFEDNL